MYVVVLFCTKIDYIIQRLVVVDLKRLKWRRKFYLFAMTMNSVLVLQECNCAKDFLLFVCPMIYYYVSYNY